MTPEQEFVCIAHRGASGHAPENTLMSVQKAMELGADWVEVDVYAVEHELVVIHDPTLERTTDGSGEVMEKSLKYLRSLNGGEGEKIPFLFEVIDVLPEGAGINIELKGPGTAESLAGFLRTRAAQRPDLKILVSSFDGNRLRKIRELAPGTWLGVLLQHLKPPAWTLAEELGAFSLHPPVNEVSRAWIREAHARRYKVFPYVANNRESIEKIRVMGADGVFTDYPDRV